MYIHKRTQGTNWVIRDIEDGVIRTVALDIRKDFPTFQ